MGILGRFDRRKARDRIRLKHHPYPAKHRIATRMQGVSTPSKYCASTSSPQKEPSQAHNTASFAVKDDKHSASDNNGQLGVIIHVDDDTATIIRNEVVNILNSSSDHSCTILEMANALAQSRACLESHSKINGKHFRFFANTSERKTKSSPTQHQRREPFKFLGRFNILSRRTEKESMRSRYQWIGALNRLEKFPSSRDQTISTWEEAKESLGKVICFPRPLLSSEESRRDQDAESSRIQNFSFAEKTCDEKLEEELEIVQENVNTLSVSNGKWKQIASYPGQHRFQSKVKKGYEKNEEEDLKAQIQIDKADLYFNARIRTAEELENQLRGSEAVKKLEERRIAIEARKRASLLMRTLNDDERKIVESAIHGFGRDDEIVAQAGADSVQRASMKTLKPGMWLNDEIIHYFYIMLAKRDEELCQNDPSRSRSHFFKSFFITKLLNEGNASCDGKYEYRNVKRWSKKVPGKDIFNLDKILFPINMGNMHWICAAIFMKKKRIEIYDSMGSNGNRYLDALFNYVQDEHMDKKKTPLPDADSWQLVPTQGDTPRQTNGTLVLKFGYIHCVTGEAS
jgi:sentrin-specific protease 1